MHADTHARTQAHTYACTQGNATAAFSVGMSYEKGEGVERNLKIAVEYYQRAAEAGSAAAQAPRPVATPIA